MEKVAVVVVEVKIEPHSTNFPIERLSRETWIAVLLF